MGSIIQREISRIKLHKPLWTHGNRVDSGDTWSLKNQKRQEGPLAGASAGSSALGRPDLRRLVSRTERGQASAVQSLHVWSFVPAALGSSRSWRQALCPDLKPLSHWRQLPAPMLFAPTMRFMRSPGSPSGTGILEGEGRHHHMTSL